MIYILDTNILRTLLSHFPKKGKIFERIWNEINLKIDIGEYISVDECYNELAKHYSEKSEEYKWIYDRKRLFKNPTSKETIIMSRLLQSPKARESVHQKNILANRPSADLYIVAKASFLSATVVTTEKYRPNSAQIPNLCEELNVQCISYDDFMEIVQAGIE